MIICNTHVQKDNYTNIFKAKPELDKYYITNNKSHGYYNGDIIMDKLPSTILPSSYEVRHGYTIHSIQGETC